ncbi:MAG: SpoIIE family protein phosphatase [Deltaproteobacteria bacterium]|nr:SpoIIE family protein phosphatase [Deltaproteobacteria bacterium]
MIELGRMSVHTQSAGREARRRVFAVVGLLGGDDIVASLTATGTSEIARHMVATAAFPDPHIVFFVCESTLGVVLRLDFRAEGISELLEQVGGLFGRVERAAAGSGLTAQTKILSRSAPSAGDALRCRQLVAEQGREELMAALSEKNRELETSFERLRREKSAKQRMESELNIGRDIQMNLLPLVFPPFPERNEFDLYARLRPAREVGGDFYDFFLIDQDHLCFVVGDVSGKGVPAALFAAVTKTLIKSRGSIDHSPGTVVTHANEELEHGNENAMFVTLWLGILHIPSGRVVYTNGGHNPPLLRRANGELELLEEIHGPIVGAMDDLAYGDDEVELRPGDSLILFTDGVTEAMDVSGALYGDERLEDLAREMPAIAPQAVVELLLDEVDRYAGEAEQADDITILALSYAGPSRDRNASLDVQIDSELAAIDGAQEEVGTFLLERGVEEEIVFHINMVLDELVNNIVSYGFDDEDDKPSIQLRVDHNPTAVCLTLIDRGKPFNPFDTEEPDTSLGIDEREIGGLGIHLVRSVMDEAKYRRHMGGNEVRLVKQLRASEPEEGSQQ